MFLPIDVNGQNKLDWVNMVALDTLEEKQNFDLLEGDKLLSDLKRSTSAHNWLVTKQQLLVRCLVIEEKLNTLQPIRRTKVRARVPSEWARDGTQLKEGKHHIY